MRFNSLLDVQWAYRFVMWQLYRDITTFCLSKIRNKKQNWQRTYCIMDWTRFQETLMQYTYIFTLQVIACKWPTSAQKNSTCNYNELNFLVEIGLSLQVRQILYPNSLHWAKSVVNIPHCVVHSNYCIRWATLKIIARSLHSCFYDITTF